MPPALKALLAQVAGWLAAFVLAKGGALPTGIWPLVAVQAAAATGAATARSEEHTSDLQSQR